MVGYAIIIILWLTIGVNSSLDYVEDTKNMPIGDKIIFSIVFLIGGPIMAIATIFQELLDCIMPEGWDDDNDKKF